MSKNHQLTREPIYYLDPINFSFPMVQWHMAFADDVAALVFPRFPFPWTLLQRVFRSWQLPSGGVWLAEFALHQMAANSNPSRIEAWGECHVWGESQHADSRKRTIASDIKICKDLAWNDWTCVFYSFLILDCPKFESFQIHLAERMVTKANLWTLGLLLGKMVVPLTINPIHTLYSGHVLGISSPFKELVGGVKQLGALHHKGRLPPFSLGDIGK